MAGVRTFKNIHDVQYILSRLALHAHALTQQLMEHMTTLTELPMWLSITITIRRTPKHLTGVLIQDACIWSSQQIRCEYVYIVRCVFTDYFRVLRLHWYTKVLWSLFCTHRHKKIKSFFSGSRCYITFLLYLCRATEKKQGTNGGRGQTAHKSFLRC